MRPPRSSPRLALEACEQAARLRGGLGPAQAVLVAATANGRMGGTMGDEVLFGARAFIRRECAPRSTG